MIKREMIDRVDEIIAKLDEEDGIFVQGMLNEIERLQKEVQQQNERLTDYSWSIYPDRMGGQFEQYEIDEASRGGHGW